MQLKLNSQEDIDSLFAAWEASIDKLAENIRRRDIAEVNLDSQLSKAIAEQKTATTAEKLAKGTPEVMQAKSEMLEADRLVRAGLCKITFIEARQNWLKLKYRQENKITA